MSDNPRYEAPEDAETDPRFPSGPWKGFFLDKRLSERRWMELDLVFKRGRVVGNGRDFVGKFVFSGAYDVKLGKCRFKKAYIGQHNVNYDGYNEGRGVWGVWSIPKDHLQGGFHIWPRELPDPSGTTLDTYVDIPVDADEAELVGAGVGDETTVSFGDRP
jgi:hypothetical protein